MYNVHYVHYDWDENIKVSSWNKHYKIITVSIRMLIIKS